MDVITAREVPLGGPRAMTVRRTLPARGRALIGAWCFVDHFGPDSVASTGGMDVPPHPHTGLQTVSWLFTGAIEHTDSLGFHQTVMPGSLSLMTAGAGIAHAEVSTPDTSILHGVQLWVALPDQSRHTPPAYEHFVPTATTIAGATVRVFLGELLGSRSPARTYTPLLGAEVTLDAGAVVEIDVDPTFEHGVLVDVAEHGVLVDVAGHGVQVDVGPAHIGPAGGHASPDDLAYLPAGETSLRLANPDPDRAARVLLIGGPPFGESVIMWWNFMGRTTEDISAAARQWNAEVDGARDHPGARFGVVPGFDGRWIPAPTMPTTRLIPRR